MFNTVRGVKGCTSWIIFLLLLKLDDYKTAAVEKKFRHTKDTISEFTRLRGMEYRHREGDELIIVLGPLNPTTPGGITSRLAASH
jgi:hypothetical protein